MSKKSTPPKNNRELNKLCRKWQKILALRDWDITVEFVRTSGEIEFLGLCDPAPKLRKAHISILNPKDYPSGLPFTYDVEQTLVHELLHCYHHMSEEGTVADLLEEQGVEATATALVRLKRAQGRKP